MFNLEISNGLLALMVKLRLLEAFFNRITRHINPLSAWMIRPTVVVNT